MTPPDSITELTVEAYNALVRASLTPVASPRIRWSPWAAGRRLGMCLEVNTAEGIETHAFVVKSPEPEPAPRVPADVPRWWDGVKVKGMAIDEAQDQTEDAPGLVLETIQTATAPDGVALVIGKAVGLPGSLPYELWEDGEVVARTPSMRHARSLAEVRAKERRPFALYDLIKWETHVV